MEKDIPQLPVEHGSFQDAVCGAKFIDRLPAVFIVPRENVLPSEVVVNLIIVGPSTIAGIVTGIGDSGCIERSYMPAAEIAGFQCLEYVGSRELPEGCREFADERMHWNAARTGGAFAQLQLAQELEVCRGNISITLG